MTTIRRPNGSIIGASVIPIGTGGGNIPGIWCRNEHYSLLTSGVFPTPSYQISILIAGGGGGGENGAGGAGGLVIRSSVTVYREAHTITIGNGGAVQYDGGYSSIEGSSLGLIKALGGGAGGYSSIYGTGHSGNDGHAGGSGGGASEWRGGGVSTSPGAALQPTSIWGGYGNRGSDASPYNRTGSGGGAGGVPTVNTGTGQNNGGIGIFSSITGTSTMYCAGGSVNAYSVSYNTTGAGAVNSGNGGGRYSIGGSGILIISYKSPGQQGSGGVTTWYVDGNGDKWWVHKFTSSGTYSG